MHKSCLIYHTLTLNSEHPVVLYSSVNSNITLFSKAISRCVGPYFQIHYQLDWADEIRLAGEGNL